MGVLPARLAESWQCRHTARRSGREVCSKTNQFSLALLLLLAAAKARLPA
jgi:hypothetical protein